MILACIEFSSAEVAAMERVELLVPRVAIEYLERDPYHGEKVGAKFVLGSDTSAVEVSYRGAYTLQTLLKVPGGPRNWKVKMGKQDPWNGFREWNFNLEAHPRQELALGLFHDADVPAVESRRAVLYVNGVRSGPYLAFPDPDDKKWIRSHWTEASGDLFKAATDIPGDSAFFGETTDLGDLDSDYRLHYQKKLNNDGPDSLDYSTLREFLVWVNRSGKEEFERDLPSRFDVDVFLRYLVVANFIGHWDGFPNRGKNYWLYQDPEDGIWSMIPWDVDATFQRSQSCLNGMGVEAGLFFMNWPVMYCGNPRESRSRPLLERILSVERWRRDYIAEYRKGMATYLSQASLHRRLDSLEAMPKPEAKGTEAADLKLAIAEIRSFVTERTAKVSSLLSAIPETKSSMLGMGIDSAPSEPVPRSGRDPLGRVARVFGPAPWLRWVRTGEP